MSNSEHLAKEAHEPLASYAAGLQAQSMPIEQWPASLVDDMVAGLMTDLLHYSTIHGRRDVSATLELVRIHFDQEAEESRQ